MSDPRIAAMQRRMTPEEYLGKGGINQTGEPVKLPFVQAAKRRISDLVQSNIVDPLYNAGYETAGPAAGAAIMAPIDMMVPENLADVIPLGATVRKAERVEGTFGKVFRTLSKPEKEKALADISIQNIVEERPKWLFHETATGASKIEKEGLQSTVGSIVENTHGMDEEAGAMRSALFFHDEPHDSGYFMAWQIANKLDKPIENVSWADIKKHGSIHIVDTDSYRGTIYRSDPKAMGDAKHWDISEPGKDTFLEHSDIPQSVERGDYWTQDWQEPDLILKGQDLVDFLKKNSNNHLIQDLKKTNE